MKPSDILTTHTVGDVAVSPDGATVVFALTTIDGEANEYRSSIWAVPADASSPARRLTAGQKRDVRPKWSPDGDRLAFVSHRESPGSELYVLSLSGGEPTRVANTNEEIEEIAWSPDGTRVAFTARDRDEDQYGPDKDRDRPPRRVDRLSFRLDSLGWTIDRPRHLWTVAADGSDDEPVQLTFGEYQDSGVTWSPDGKWIAFASGRTDTWDTDLAIDLYRVPAAGGEPERLTEGTVTHGSPVWSPDGTRIAFVWGDRRSMPRFGQIGVLDVVRGEETILTRDLDLHCAPYLAFAREPVWDGDSLLFQADDRGNVPVWRVRLEGGSEEVLGGQRQVIGFDLAGGTFAFASSDATGLPEVFAVHGSGERALTDFGSEFHTSVPGIAPERFVATSSDGTEVEAWIVRPVEFEESRKYPALLNIHGGPFSQYGNRFFDEFQVQAGAGYAVIYSNPRGSSGYGEAFARGIRGPNAKEDPGRGWGGADYEDLMAVMDEALRRFDFIDGGRIGVIGGSYGGYMTSWIVGHTDRFQAACSERSLNNMMTFAHTSDIGAHFPAAYIGANHIEDPDEFVRQSPTTYAENIRAPLLILHSENDLRCPIEQAEDLFLRLKLLGRDVEFVRFPGESHELSRSGAPQHRVTRMETILDFFDRHLS